MLRGRTVWRLRVLQLCSLLVLYAALCPALCFAHPSVAGPLPTAHSACHDEVPPPDLPAPPHSNSCCDRHSHVAVASDAVTSVPLLAATLVLLHDVTTAPWLADQPFAVPAMHDPPVRYIVPLYITEQRLII